MNTLRIKVSDESLIPLYEKRVNIEGDAGVDLYFPEQVSIPPLSVGFKIDLKINGEMVHAVHSQLTDNIPKEMLTGMNIKDKSLSYMIVPRSSIIKTPLRMSNSVGIIDSGYRGNYIVTVDNLSEEEFVIEKHSRLFQVISPMLNPIQLEIVGNLSVSQRGKDGFGSTGS